MNLLPGPPRTPALHTMVAHPGEMAVSGVLGVCERRPRPPALRARLLAGTTLAACALAACTLAACARASDLSGPLASRVRAWASATGIVALDGQVASDVRHAHTLDVTAGGHQLATGCVVLGDDVRQANGELPSPDQILTDELSTAYTTLLGAAEECEKAAEEGDRPAIAASLAQADAGSRGLSIAAERLTALERR